jgi:hypothetical protein
MRIGSPTFNVTLMLAALGCTAAGCHSIPDPSCAVCEELSDDRCRSCFYCPNVCTDPLRDSHWYLCPTVWQPNCSPLGGQLAGPPAALAKASDVFALPNQVGSFLPSGRNESGSRQDSFRKPLEGPGGR